MTHANEPSLGAAPPTPQLSAQTSESATDPGGMVSSPDAPSTDESSIPLPPLEAPPRKRTTPERLAVEIRRLDAALMAVVLALAFLVAAFTARNSHLWMRLATGRLLVHSHYSFGADPYSYTPTNY